MPKGCSALTTDLKNLKTKKDDLDVNALITLSIDFKELRDVVDKNVVKKTVYNTLNTKINSLEKKTTYASTLIKANQYNTGKQNSEKKMEMLRRKFLISVV